METRIRLQVRLCMSCSSMASDPLVSPCQGHTGCQPPLALQPADPLSIHLPIPCSGWRYRRTGFQRPCLPLPRIRLSGKLWPRQEVPCSCCCTTALRCRLVH